MTPTNYLDAPTSGRYRDKTYRQHSRRIVCRNGLSFVVRRRHDRETVDLLDVNRTLASLAPYRLEVQTKGHNSTVVYAACPVDPANRLIARNGGLADAERLRENAFSKNIQLPA